METVADMENAIVIVDALVTIGIKDQNVIEKNQKPNIVTIVVNLKMELANALMKTTKEIDVSSMLTDLSVQITVVNTELVNQNLTITMKKEVGNLSQPVSVTINGETKTVRKKDNVLIVLNAIPIKNVNIICVLARKDIMEKDAQNLTVMRLTTVTEMENALLRTLANAM